jgi:hypothetical protein
MSPYDVVERDTEIEQLRQLCRTARIEGYPETDVYGSSNPFAIVLRNLWPKMFHPWGYCKPVWNESIAYLMRRLEEFERERLLI